MEGRATFQSLAIDATRLDMHDTSVHAVIEKAEIHQAFDRRHSDQKRLALLSANNVSHTTRLTAHQLLLPTSCR